MVSAAYTSSTTVWDQIPLADLDDDFNATVTLFNLKQVTNVRDYQDKFETIVHRMNLSQESAVYFFVRGLNDEIQDLVRRFVPRTLHEAYGLAKLEELTISYLQRDGSHVSSLKSASRISHQPDVCIKHQNLKSPVETKGTLPNFCSNLNVKINQTIDSMGDSSSLQALPKKGDPVENKEIGKTCFPYISLPIHGVSLRFFAHSSYDSLKTYNMVLKAPNWHFVENVSHTDNSATTKKYFSPIMKSATTPSSKICWHAGEQHFSTTAPTTVQKIDSAQEVDRKFLLKLQPVCTNHNSLKSVVQLFDERPQKDISWQFIVKAYSSYEFLIVLRGLLHQFNELNYKGCLFTVPTSLANQNYIATIKGKHVLRYFKEDNIHEFMFDQLDDGYFNFPTTFYDNSSSIAKHLEIFQTCQGVGIYFQGTSSPIFMDSQELCRKGSEFLKSVHWLALKGYHPLYEDICRGAAFLNDFSLREQTFNDRQCLDQVPLALFLLTIRDHQGFYPLVITEVEQLAYISAYTYFQTFREDEVLTNMASVTLAFRTHAEDSTQTRKFSQRIISMLLCLCLTWKVNQDHKMVLMHLLLFPNAHYNFACNGKNEQFHSRMQEIQWGIPGALSTPHNLIIREPKGRDLYDDISLIPSVYVQDLLIHRSITVHIQALFQKKLHAQHLTFYMHYWGSQTLGHSLHSSITMPSRASVATFSHMVFYGLDQSFPQGEKHTLNASGMRHEQSVIGMLRMNWDPGGLSE